MKKVNFRSEPSSPLLPWAFLFRRLPLGGDLESSAPRGGRGLVELG